MTFQKGNTIWLGREFTKEHRENISKAKKGWNGVTGRPVSTETRKKIGDAQREEKGNNWKGNRVKYTGLHAWVYRQLGQPTKCEQCGKDGLVGAQIHWANVSHKYLRKLSDWIRLCVSCHKKYDLSYPRV